MSEIKFTIKLNRKELSALAVFKPELQQIIDEYDNNFNLFVDKLSLVIGILKYFSNNSCNNHLSKVRLLQNILYDYFFLDSTKSFVAEFIFDNNDYNKLISCFDTIYYSTFDIIEEEHFSNNDRIEFFKDYFQKISELSLKI